jgi:Type I phosphodiesterase / nucleotide pyrophosphatase
MRRFIILIILLATFNRFAAAQETENVILITLDGFRWQELFQGADSSILVNKAYIKNYQTTSDRFWGSSPDERRKKLMPFFWDTIASQGQLYGNRLYGNQVNCANPYWFSYPGYSEMLVGFVDRSVRSNENIENPNGSVLEFIEQQKGFEDSVAVFSTWETLPYIIRASTNGIYTNCGKDVAKHGDLSERELLLNEMQPHAKNPYGSRYDAFTFHYAWEYLKRKRPRVMMINFDETDEYSHKGKYDAYLQAASQADQMIGQLWAWLQQDKQYAGKTTLIITTDHGRGQGAKQAWKSHGRLCAGSSQMWIAVIGPDTPALGEITAEGQYFQKQVAKTIAEFLGLNYTNEKPVADAITPMIRRERFARDQAALLTVKLPD